MMLIQSSLHPPVPRNNTEDMTSVWIHRFTGNIAQKQLIRNQSCLQTRISNLVLQVTGSYMNTEVKTVLVISCSWCFQDLSSTKEQIDNTKGCFPLNFNLYCCLFSHKTGTWETNKSNLKLFSLIVLLAATIHSKRQLRGWVDSKTNSQKKVNFMFINWNNDNKLKLAYGDELNRLKLDDMTW